MLLPTISLIARPERAVPSTSAVRLISPETLHVSRISKEPVHGRLKNKGISESITVMRAGYPWIL